MPRWVRWAAAAGAVLAVLLAVVVHTPPFRRAVLRRVVVTLADRLDVALRADSLRYDILSRRVALTGVSVASVDSPDEPFLTADLIEITAARSALLGRFAIDRFHLDNAHLNIRRRGDGTTNLPPGGAADPGEPQAVPIGRLTAPRLAVTLADAAQQLSLSFPALSLDIGRTAGAIRLVTPGRLDRGDRSTRISEFGGGVSFDGRAVHLDGFVAAVEQGRVVLDGTLALLVRQPTADLRVTGETEVAALARFLRAEPVVTGVVSLGGTVTGPFEQPLATVRLQSASLVWQELTLSSVDVQVAADSREVRIADARGTLADGTVSADGILSRPDGGTTLTVAWTGVDLSRLVRSIDPAAPVRPGGRMTGSARLTGAGSDLAGWTLDATTRVGAPPPGQVAIPGTATLAVSGGRWRLRADHAVEGVPVRARLAGRLASGGLAASTLDGTVTVVETGVPQLIVALRRLGVDVPADLVTAGRGQVDAELAGTVRAPHVDVTARVGGLDTRGIRGADLDLTARGTFDTMAVEARLRHGTDNEATAAGTLLLRGRRLDARVTGRLSDPRGLVPDLPVAGEVLFELDADGLFSALTARGTITAVDAAYGGFPLGRIEADIDADGEAVRADVVVPEFGARGRTAVALTPRTATFNLEIDDADLGRVVRDVESPLPAFGTLTLAVRGEAPLDDWQRGSATLDVSRLDARVGDLPVRLAEPARVSYAAGAIDVRSLEADLGNLRLSVMGRLPASASDPPVPAAEALRALLVGDIADVAAAARAIGVGDLPPVSGRGQLGIVASVTGSAAAPTVAADLDLSEGELAFADLPPARRINIRAHVAEGWIEPLLVSGEWQESRVTASGRVPLRVFAGHLPNDVIAALPPTTGPATFTARAESITPAVLAPFVEADVLDQIDGAVDASLQIEASTLAPEDIRGEARLDRLDVRIAGLPIGQRQATRIVFENGVGRVAAWDWAGQGATLGVQGQVRLADGEAAIRSAGRFDLRLLTPFLRDSGLTLSGTLAPRVAVSGPITGPRLDGEVALEAGEVRLRDPRIVAAGVTAFAVLGPEEARITSIAGVVNGGALAGTGRVEYGAGKAPALRVSGTIAGMGLEMPEGLRSELDVDAAVSLINAPEGARGSVTGMVTVLRSAYREPLAVVTGLLGALRSERLATAAAEPDSLAARMALDVRVTTDSDIIVDNNIARLELGGDLRVIGTAAAPALSGRAELRQGGQLFLGRNVYTIDSGTIDFVDPVTVTPVLNVEATTRAGGHEIALTLSGPADDLTPDLRSLTEPETPQADVVSLLLTGRTLEQVPGAEARIVGEQVLGYLSGDVLGLASRAVGLDTIRLGGPDAAGLRRDPTAVAVETDPTSRLTFGKSIGRNVDLAYSQSLRDGSAQTWIVDYQPISQVNLRLVARDDHRRSYEFRHDISVGGPEQTRRAERVTREVDVDDVSITGDPAGLEEDLRQVLRLEPGDTFDFSEWQRDRDRLEERLHAEGRLEARVLTRREARDDGVRLVYEVSAGPRTAITVAGYQPSAEVRRRIEQAWALSVFDDFLEEEAAEIVRTTLADEGYIEAEVSADVAGGDPKTLAIAVQPGRRAVERRLAIQAEDETLAEELDRWARRTGLDSWRTPEGVEDALAAELRSRGHLRAEVTAGTPRIDGRTAVLPVNVEAGPMFTVGEITFAGAQRAGGDRLRGVARLATGDRYDPAAVEAARGRIEASYRLEGFAAARATVETTSLPGAVEVPVVFRIDEGPQQVLREITVRGNRSIDTDIITRAMRLEPGAPLAANAWVQARARLFDTGLFRRVDVTTEALSESPTTEERPMRAVVSVEEWPGLRLRYGLQLSEERPEDRIEGRDLTPGLSADVTRRTLFGRAVTVGAAAEYQRRERLARVFMSAPTMFRLPVESLLTAERSRRTFADATFVTDRSGVSWEQRARTLPNLQLSYAYRFDRDHTFDTAPPNPLFPAFDVVANVARLTGSAAYDTRDDPTDTRRGSLFSWSLELAPESLGSDFQFVRQVGQAYYFRPWRDAVFASAARVGLASPRGGQAMLPSELFFAGGARTVRGVPEESLGPRDVFGDPAGGRSLLVLNQEARFPLFGWVRGVGFIDSGNVFARPGDLGFRGLVTSLGAGVRVATPFALLRADVARLVSGGPAPRTFRWTFGIGHTF